ncbi:phosphate-binding protein [Xylophilus rhododendri]|uniref:Phosphate-binding protein n=1 Tax=Xylophilus rhododendri TaxID=2697032 RepID=A0A857J9C4_9BURK|nr:substrate-binding domain-containing protein [Xylophilus rhododendri]QHJ00338.1 phosphate-binding protein [Xylophilus rhododendri]
MKTLRALCLAGLGLASGLHAQTLFQPPADASWVLPDGSVSIVGNDGMETLVQDLNRLYADTHPGVRFRVNMNGSSTGMPALTAGATPFAPMSRDIWPIDRSAFVQTFGYAPVAIRIGYNGHGPRAPEKTPPAVYVNQANPLPGLTLQQLARVFTAGQDGGDVSRWSQLGMQGEWAQRRIHVYGLRDDGGFATSLRLQRFGGLPFSPRYEALDSREAVIRAVAADPFGIGLLGWIDASATSKDVRVLPLAAAPGQAFHGPSYEEVHAGLYPLSAPLQLVVNRRPGEPLPAFVLEYLRLALSDAGQALVERQKDSEEGYVPLSPADLSAERHKLEKLHRQDG